MVSLLGAIVIIRIRFVELVLNLRLRFEREFALPAEGVAIRVVVKGVFTV